MKKLLAILIGVSLGLSSLGAASAANLKSFEKVTLSLSGSALVGEEITVTPTGFPSGTVFAYAWYVGGGLYESSTGTSFLVEPSMEGLIVRARVVAKRAGYKSLTSYTMNIVTGSPFLVSPPSIAGKLNTNAAVYSRCGVWLPQPESCDFSWEIDAIDSGEIGSLFVIPSNAAGSRLRVKATAHFSSGESIAAQSSLVGPIVGEINTPSLVGEPLQGSRIYVSVDSEVPGLLSKYQWNRDGKAIKGATKFAYRPNSSDFRHKITVTIRSTAPHFSAREDTLTLGLVSLAKIYFSNGPVVTGSPLQGSTLRVSRPSSSAPETKLSYQWLRNGKKIPGATKMSYKTGSSDYKAKIQVQVTATAPNHEPRIQKVLAASSIGILKTKFGKRYLGYSSLDFCDYEGYYSCESWFLPDSQSARLYTNGDFGEYVYGSFSLPMPVTANRVIRWRVHMNASTSSNAGALVVPATGPGFLNGVPSLGSLGAGSTWTSNWTSLGVGGNNAYFGVYVSGWGAASVGDCWIEAQYIG